MRKRRAPSVNSTQIIGSHQSGQRSIRFAIRINVHTIRARARARIYSSARSARGLRPSLAGRRSIISL